MVVLMIASTFPLVRETALILMQTTPGFIEVEEIKKELLKVSFENDLNATNIQISQFNSIALMPLQFPICFDMNFPIVHSVVQECTLVCFTKHPNKFLIFFLIMFKFM